MYVAALDTCVLWPSLQRDFLLSLAVTNVFQPVWSDVVLEELERHEAIKLQRRHSVGEEEAATCAARLIGQMRIRFEGATVDAWDCVKPVGLPDPDDEHVLGAAIVAGAEVIVTENHKDFPAALLPRSLRTESAADFIDAMVIAQPSSPLTRFARCPYGASIPPSHRATFWTCSRLGTGSIREPTCCGGGCDGRTRRFATGSSLIRGLSGSLVMSSWERAQQGMD
ncbi:PIN domain-containing protein [Agrococcus sp. Ld7]|uniref:PIN domain-containing protein n=1 Tax=Agrococcus sp. Ld7 TaxID=649148 RepID=UPI00386EB0C5